jgi:segregation and condensation protein B
MTLSEQDIGFSSKAVIEAALFASGKILSIRELSELSDMTEGDVLLLAQELATEYSLRGSGLEILSLGDGYVMQVRAALVHKVMSVAPREIDAPLIRTLAIIAYKQPIKQSVLAEIRGNKSYEHVRELERMGLIGCSKQGRTKIITTTSAFADYFGMDSDRPESIRKSIMGDKRPIGVTPMYESLALRLGLNFVVVNAYKPSQNDLERLKDIELLVIAPGYEEQVREHYPGRIIEAGIGTLSKLKESAEKICVACSAGDIEPLASEIDVLLQGYRERTKASRPIRALTPIVEDMARDLRIPVQDDGTPAASDCSGLDAVAVILVPTHQPYDMDVLERIKQRYDRLLDSGK